MARHTLARTRTRRALYLRDPNEGGGGSTGSTGGTDGGQAGGSTGGTDGGNGSTGDSGADGGNDKPGGQTFSKDDVERIVTDRLARERAAAERRQQQATRTEAQRIEQLERDLAEERLARTRVDVASKTPGLSADWADDLKGDTREDLEAHAKRLADRLKSAGGTGGGTTRTRGGQRRTVTESGGTGMTAKERAAFALRGMRGGGSDD